jgi:cyclopropane fatty-acyl-phospholipid synthase-like methyltransferase
MKTTLHLGCGLAVLADAVNHDKAAHSEHVDVAHDLDVTPWPWQEGQFKSIVALDVVEHLKVDVDVWLNECHRILEDDGVLVIRVPHYKHENAFTDPTHRRFFTESTFDYWDKSKVLHQKYGCFYYADADRWWSVSCESSHADIQFWLKKNQ